HSVLLTAASWVAWSFISFLLIAEGFFFEEFQSRFNPVAVDYLLYPHEVFVNIWETYPVIAVVIICGLMGALITGLSCRMGLAGAPLRNSSPSARAALLWCLAAALSLATYRG